MKICKVVVSSALNDARVLKEAKALVDDGHEVTVVGIQDAHNSVPIHQLPSGVVVRLAAWQARAARPLYWTYFGRLLLVGWVLLLAVLCISLLAYRWPTDLTLTWFDGLMVAAIAIFARYGWLLAADYLKRRRTWRGLKRAEKNQQLKYHAALKQHTDIIAPAVAGETVTRTRRKRRWRLIDFMPRPLMHGPVAMLLPAHVARWNLVFAREAGIRAILEDEAPAVVHAHDLAALPVAADYARRHRAKLVFDAHEMYDHLAQAEDEMSDINAAILRKYSRQVDLFITINDSIADYYARTYKRLPSATIIKNATRYVEPFTYDGRLHAAAGLPLSQRIVIFQGGFAPKRGLMPLLLSAEYLQPGWSLVFMGWGKLENELRRVADALKVKNPELADRIRFVPRVKQEELPYWTAGASLGIIPYENSGLNHWYCTPNKLWEYPNAAVPILASPFPELRRVVEGHAVGWLLPDPLTPAGIAAVINGLSDDEMHEAALRCRSFIAHDNWEHYAAQLQHAYRGL